jgi:hypothetical protein
MLNITVKSAWDDVVLSSEITYCFTSGTKEDRPRARFAVLYEGFGRLFGPVEDTRCDVEHTI